MSGTIDVRQPRYGLTVAGRTRTILGGTVDQGTDIFVATADLTLDPAEGRPAPGDAVVVRAGYASDWPLPLIFVGAVDDDSLTLWPWDGQVRCSGTLNRATLPIGTPRLPTDPGYGNLPLPSDPAHDPDVVCYYDSAGSGRTWTDGQIVTDILARYGIVDVQIADSGTVLATLYPLVITRAQNGAQVIQEIDELLGYRTYDGPDGVVRRVPISRNPSGGYARWYQEGIDLYRATHTRSRRQVRNRVICQGSVPNLRGSTGTPYQPVGLAQASSPYVPTPPGYQEHSWATNLAETQALCQAYAARKLGELNRLTETASYDLLLGDSRLAPNMTVRIDAAHLSLNNASRSRIVHVRHQLGAALNTSIQVTTVTKAEGINPNQPPVAIIDALAERETLADGSALTIVALDGTNSYDPDGQAALAPDRGIASYLWTASQGTITATSGGRLATLLIVGNPAPSASVTLTVTASDNGATGSATRLVGASGLPVQVRDIWAALNSDLQFSNDGQKTWQSFGIPAVGVCEVAAPTYNLAWDASGQLYRCLSTLTSTPVTNGPTGITAASISLDTQGVPTHIAWAAGANGAVWRSTDDGQTWPAATAIPSGTVTAIVESPYSPGDVTAIAGGTTWHSYDAGASWQAQDSYPTAGLTARRFAAGVAADGVARGFTAYASTAVPPSGSDQGVVRERAGLVTTNFAATATPMQITGLTLSLDGTSLVATDYSGNVGRSWQIDATAGGTWAARQYDGTWGLPRHIIRDGRLPGLIYGAGDTALFKTPNEFVSTLTMRSLSGSLQGRMIGYGDLHPVLPVAGDMIWIAATVNSSNGTLSGAVINALTATGFVRRASAAAFPMPNGSTLIPLRQVAPGILLAFGVIRSPANDKPQPVGAANCLRSTDGGATWTAIGVPYISWLATDGRGGCYALAWATDGTQTGPGAGLYRSTDGGVTWTFCIRFDGNSNSGPRAQHVVANPINPDRVMVRNTALPGQGTAYFLSTDGGLTLTEAVDVYDAFASYGGICGAYSPDGTALLTRNEADNQPLVRSPEAGPAGATVLGATDASTLQAFAVSAAGIAVSGAQGAWLSDDQGVTWTRILNDQGVNVPIDGFVAGDASKAWYALTSTGIQQQAATATPTPSGWTPIAASVLSAAFPDGVTRCVPQGALTLAVS